jgi:hypothetical protein
MRTDEIAESLEVASLTVQLAVSAAVEELRSKSDQITEDGRKALKLALSTAYGRMRGTYGAFVTEPREYPADAPNVVTLPVKPRTSWTVLRHLDGRRWACSSGFGPGGAWSWIVESVMAEHGVNEDAIGNREGVEDQYDGDDLVTVDGEPVYRIEHTVSPFEK